MIKQKILEKLSQDDFLSILFENIAKELTSSIKRKEHLITYGKSADSKLIYTLSKKESFYLNYVPDTFQFLVDSLEKENMYLFLRELDNGIVRFEVHLNDLKDFNSLNQKSLNLDNLIGESLFEKLMNLKAKDKKCFWIESNDLIIESGDLNLLIKKNGSVFKSKFKKLTDTNEKFNPVEVFNLFKGV